MTKHCPVCGDVCVPPYGPKESPVLVIGEFPGKAELERGRPFTTHHMFTTAGHVFRKELSLVGVDLNNLRTMNLWLHEPNLNINPETNEKCFKVGYELALDEAKGRQAILLVGSDVVSSFTKFKVMDVAGLQVDSFILGAPIIYAMPNPALALQPGRGIGEVRLSIQKFVSRLEKEGLL